MERRDQRPCGRLIPSGYKDGRLEYNEYAAYDPEHVWQFVRKVGGD